MTRRSKFRGVNSNMIFLSFGRGQSDGRVHLTKRNLSNCVLALCTANRPVTDVLRLQMQDYGHAHGN